MKFEHRFRVKASLDQVAQFHSRSASMVARIENAGKNGFTDRQVRGPFASWVHRHNFRKVTPEVTEVYDHVEATVKRHAFWGPVGWLMWLGMPILFRFRGSRTRRLLETN